MSKQSNTKPATGSSGSTSRDTSPSPNRLEGAAYFRDLKQSRLVKGRPPRALQPPSPPQQSAVPTPSRTIQAPKPSQLVSVVRAPTIGGPGAGGSQGFPGDTTPVAQQGKTTPVPAIRPAASNTQGNQATHSHGIYTGGVPSGASGDQLGYTAHVEATHPLPGSLVQKLAKKVSQSTLAITGKGKGKGK